MRTAVKRAAAGWLRSAVGWLGVTAGWLGVTAGWPPAAAGWVRCVRGCVPGCVRGSVRLARFGVSGGIATAIHVGIVATLVDGFAASPVWANCVAFVVAAVCSYLLNTLWSFSARPGAHNFLRFLCVSVLGLLVTLAISGAAQALGAGYRAGLVAVLLMVPPMTFCLHRYWTYAPARPSAAAHPQR